MSDTDTYVMTDAPVSSPTAFPGTEKVDASTVFSGPGYNAPQPRTNPAATVAMWLSTLSLVIALMLPVTLVLSAIALRTSLSDDNSQAGRHEATAGIILSIIGLVTWGLILYVAFFHRG